MRRTTCSGGTRGTRSWAGAGGDVLVGGAGGDTLEGGEGSDEYRFENGWGDDTLKENAKEGKDTLNFEKVTDELTFTYQADGLHVTTSDSSLEAAGNAGMREVEVVKVGAGINRFVIEKEFTAANDFEIDASGASSAILDFSDFPAQLSSKDLTLTFTFENQKLTVTQKRGATVWPNFKIVVTKGLENLSVVGGAGDEQLPVQGRDRDRGDAHVTRRRGEERARLRRVQRGRDREPQRLGSGATRGPGDPDQERGGPGSGHLQPVLSRRRTGRSRSRSTWTGWRRPPPPSTWTGFVRTRRF